MTLDMDRRYLFLYLVQPGSETQPRPHQVTEGTFPGTSSPSHWRYLSRHVLTKSLKVPFPGVKQP